MAEHLCSSCRWYQPYCSTPICHKTPPPSFMGDWCTGYARLGETHRKGSSLIDRRRYNGAQPGPLTPDSPKPPE